MSRLWLIRISRKCQENCRIMLLKKSEKETEAEVKEIIEEAETPIAERAAETEELKEKEEGGNFFTKLFTLETGSSTLIANNS